MAIWGNYWIIEIHPPARHCFVSFTLPSPHPSTAGGRTVQIYQVNFYKPGKCNSSSVSSSVIHLWTVHIISMITYSFIIAQRRIERDGYLQRALQCDSCSNNCIQNVQVAVYVCWGKANMGVIINSDIVTSRLLLSSWTVNIYPLAIYLNHHHVHHHRHRSMPSVRLLRFKRCVNVDYAEDAALQFVISLSWACDACPIWLDGLYIIFYVRR